MEKHLYFEELHERLAQELALSLGAVSTIRTLTVHDKMDRNQVIAWALRTGQRPHDKRKRSQRFYYDILNFATSCTADQWKSITQPTPFDKRAGLEALK